MRGSSRPHSIAALAGMAAVALGCGQVQVDPPDALPDPPEHPCVYPTAAYGYLPGEVLPPTLAWQGLTEAGATSTISLGDYYDCDGSRGINAILVAQSTVWCGVCQTMAQSLAENLREGWRAQGIHVLTLITQSGDQSPATLSTAQAWRRRFRLEGTAVAADPMRSLRGTAGEETAPYPYHVVIDPRTMRTMSIDAGFGGNEDFAGLLELARENGR